MEIKSGFMWGTRSYEVTLSDDEALSEEQRKDMSITQRACYTAAMCDILAIDYARTEGLMDPEVALSRFAQLREKLITCQK